MLSLTLLRNLDLEEPTAPGRRAHIAAASGLVRAGRHFYVVADDENHLAVFPTKGSGKGRLIRLFDGKLPAEAGARKARKPDMESLVLLPVTSEHPDGALLALGSGSTSLRQRGALLALDRKGAVPGAAEPIDLAPLFEAIGAAFAEPNIEGAVVSGQDLLLFQRGNATHPDNAVIRVGLDAVIAQRPPEKFSVRRVDLGEIDGVPLCFTDASILPNGDIAFAAVAEDTADSYRDGALLGAAVGILDADMSLRRIERLDPSVKVEGIDARWEDGAVELLLVTDADDPERPAGLFSARLALEG